MRFNNIDYFKGVLIILVVMGHVLQGTGEQSFSRYMIYSFHMPIFIGVSGFLFNLDKVASLNFLELFRKYQFRVIIPWIISVVFYFFLNRNDYSPIAIINSFVAPFYHLWFIPGFLSWIVICYFLKRIIRNEDWILICAMAISLVSLIIKEEYTSIIPGSRTFLHTFRPYFLFFFVLGNRLRHVEMKSLNLYTLTTLAVLFALEMLLFFYRNSVLEFLNFFVLNSILLFSILTITKNNMVKKSRLMEWIGVNSLGIYLWHVVPIILVKNFIGTDQLFKFYLFAFLSEIGLFITYFFLVKIDVLRKCLFGL